MNYLRNCILPAVFISQSLLISSVQAATPVSSNMDINMSGTIVATASCTFNDPAPAQIEFNDTYVNEITGEKYKQPVPFQVTCKGDPDGKTIQMQVNGTVASNNANNLKTDVGGLSIKLLKGSDPLAVNQWFNLDPANPPVLYAVLEKQSGISFLDGQVFNASATLQVAYN